MSILKLSLTTVFDESKNKNTHSSISVLPRGLLVPKES